MRFWLPAAVLLSAALAFGQPGSPQLAKVTIAGKEGATNSGTIAGVKFQVVLLDTEGGTIRVKTNQDVAALNDDLLAMHKKLADLHTAQVKKLVENNEVGRIKDAEQSFKAASDELLKYLSAYAAEGTVSLAGGEIEMEGRLRLLAFKGEDSALGKGKAQVVGQVATVKDKDGIPRLAIANGASPIVIVGKLADPRLDLGRTIKARGILRSGGKTGPLTLEPEALDLAPAGVK